MILPEYTPGYQLGPDEYLLKVKSSNNHKVGFLTKLTQKGQLPKSFEDWGEDHRWGAKPVPLTAYIHTETFKSGWSLDHWRIGKSQEWAVMNHPDGFRVEIYLSSFLELVQSCTIINGELQGEFKWAYSKLEKLIHV